jgi:hypothetical protein
LILLDLANLSILLSIASAVFGFVALWYQFVGGIGAALCGLGSALAAWRASVQADARVRAAIQHEGEQARAFAVGLNMFLN